MTLVLAIASTVPLLAVALFLYTLALIFAGLSRSKPSASVEDETPDEVLEVDGPTSRPYIPLSSRHVWPQPPAEVFDQPDDVWEIHASEPKPKLHRLCVEAYADRRYSDICKACTPRMGVRP